MRISDWSSDVCSSDLLRLFPFGDARRLEAVLLSRPHVEADEIDEIGAHQHQLRHDRIIVVGHRQRSEEHTSELQSLMRISYAVFCLKKKNTEQQHLNKYTEPQT